jgi:peroxiredoxin
MVVAGKTPENGVMQKTLICLLLWCLSGPLLANDVPDFSLIDQNGRFHQLGRSTDKRAVVILLFDPSDPVGRAAVQEMGRLQERFQGDPVSFQVLVADLAQTRTSLKNLAQAMGVPQLPLLLDESQLVTQALGLERSGEVLVVEPSRLQSVYQGAVGLFNGNPTQQSLAATLPGMSSYLHYILHSVIRGEPFIQASYALNGPVVRLPALDSVRQEGVSYADDVAPILRDRCAGCHRDGGVAPWSMNGHLMVQGWSTMIKETLLTRRMPPGQVDYHYAADFEDVNHISNHEMQVLMQWINEGAKRVPEERDPLADLPEPESGWALGEPDLVIDLPEQEIPATGVLDYSFVPVELNLEEDKWVSAFEFDVDNKVALHHVIIYTQDERQQRQNASRGGSRTNFGGYAPGREHIELGDDAGILLSKDMRLMIQLHYTTVGRDVTDHTRLGLYFRDTPPRQELVRTAVMNGDFEIPPGVREFPVEASVTVTEDSYLHSFAPHMHYRGKRVAFTARYPDGREESLLSIPNFQHNWQMVYRLKEPVFLPAGTEIVADGAFDNSAFNPLNPDPEKSVSWGEQVWDEMFLTWLRLSVVKE